MWPNFFPEISFWISDCHWPSLWVPNQICFCPLTRRRKPLDKLFCIALSSRYPRDSYSPLPFCKSPRVSRKIDLICRQLWAVASNSPVDFPPKISFWVQDQRFHLKAASSRSICLIFLRDPRVEPSLKDGIQNGPSPRAQDHHQRHQLPFSPVWFWYKIPDLKAEN